MNKISFYDNNIGWAIFWSSYWFFATIMTIYSHNKGYCQVKELPLVVLVLIRNMFVTLIITNMLIILPIGLLYFLPIWMKYIFCLLSADLFFFYSHYMLHHRWFYKSIHKMHHEFIDPYPLVAIYCTTTELIVSNIIPVVIGPLLTVMDGIHLYIWLLIITFDITLAHSGLLNIRIYNDAHDKHHKYLDCNFGILNHFDWLHGTLYA